MYEAEIKFTRNFPRLGRRAFEYSVTFGYATVPREVEALATMLSARRVLMSSFGNAQNGNWDSVAVADISLSKGGLAGIKSLDSIERDIANQWEVVGLLYSEIV